MNKEKADDKASGPKFQVNIEGTIHPWERDSITTEELIKLGGWAASEGVIVIDEDNNERTLKPNETVQLKPGQGFAKKVKFKRG